MVEIDGGELREVLSKRHIVLEALLDDWKTRPQLVDELNYSRSTIDRAIDDLCDAGCIERTGSEFRATFPGKLALETHQQYQNKTKLIQQETDLLANLSFDSPLDHSFLDGAQIYSSATTPGVADQPVYDLLPSATKFTGISPVIYREYLEALTDRLHDGGFDLEVIATTELLESMQENYADEFASLAEFNSIDVYVIDEFPSHSLWVLYQDSATYAGMAIFDEGGKKGSIINDSDEAVAWVENQYRQYRDASTRMI